VVGHTVQNNGIEPYCEGRVWRVDLGMSEAFDGYKDSLKVVGGIKIFQYPNQSRPFEILSIMNYSDIYKFLWFIKKSYNNVTSQQKKWLQEIKEIHKFHTSRVTYKN
jgi:CO dehydrogenase/acetyl-CoA synthase delta subunit